MTAAVALIALFQTLNFTSTEQCELGANRVARVAALEAHDRYSKTNIDDDLNVIQDWHRECRRKVRKRK